MIYLHYSMNYQKKDRGRPELKPEQRRKNRSFAASEDEFEKMKVAANGDAFGTWARKKLLEASK